MQSEPKVRSAPRPAPIDQDAGWGTLGLVLVACFMLATDASLLNVSLPAIGRDLGGDLVLLKWVVTGKSLVFASLMLTGGRLGDIFGHRRMFLAGGLLYGIGGITAATSSSVPGLILGESVIKGIGVTIMLPSTMAVLSHAYHGRQRSVAFAAWGGCAGAGAAFGPVIGGILTTQLSWRWCIGLTAALAPLVIVGAARMLDRTTAPERRSRLDGVGSLLIAASVMFLVVGLSEGGRLGWWHALADVTLGDTLVWSRDWRVAPTPILFAVAAVTLVLFIGQELRQARVGREPMFDVRNLRRPAYRYGLVTGVLAASGQWGVVFILPIFLQLGLGLSPMEAGLWLLPAGLSTLVFAQLGGRLGASRDPSVVVRMGLVVQAIGTLAVALVLRPGAATALLVPGLVLYGIGFGLVTSQLANTVISSVALRQAGVASAATITARQIGAAFGVAVLGSLLTVGSTERLLDGVERSPTLEAGARSALVAQIDSEGLDLRSLASRDDPIVTQLVERSLAESARTPILLAATLVAIGATLRAPSRVFGRRRRGETPPPQLP